MDANILIDFINCDKTILKLICSHVGDLYLASPVLNEVNEITEGDCLELGITLVEPTLKQIMMSSGKRGRLSFQDHLCLTIAKENGWTCITNDVPLRKECQSEGVSLIWGIELICILVESGGLPIKHSKSIILKIQRNNPKYITNDIVKRAFERLGIR